MDFLYVQHAILSRCQSVLCLLVDGYNTKCIFSIFSFLQYYSIIYINNIARVNVHQILNQFLFRNDNQGAQ